MTGIEIATIGAVAAESSAAATAGVAATIGGASAAGLAGAAGTTITLGNVLTAAALLGTVGSAVLQGRQAKQTSDYQSAVMHQEMDRERQQAAADADDFSRRESAAMGTRRALMGASGVESGTGSPLIASEDFAGEAELARQRILNGGEVAATRLDESATLATRAGSNAEIGGFARGGALLLNGIGKGIN